MDVPRRLEDAREGLNIRSWLSVYQRDRSGGVYHMHADSGSEAGLGNASRLSHLALDPGTLLRPLPLGGVNWLDLERVEDRYLLAASSDASVLLYDTQGQEEEAAGQVPPGQGPALPGLAPLLSLTKASPGGHRFSVSSAAWYPLDNGLFVTGALALTRDGLRVVSAGADDAVRAWDGASFRNTLVNFAGAFNRARRPRQLALARDPDALFLPSGSAVLGYDLRSGAALCTLRGGHHEAVHACVWSEAGGGTLYTGGADRLVLTWRPRAGRGEDEEDAWSE
ncbi:hypothetical protein APUTEX25_004579 [Auxenochlorella protothecoides]|uniref:Uncharacterized protein n=1 Tax=Auxenochlorella protothecoides TaxID=3075 RepID=A0A3M7L2C8_AUXPR|nr:hypothetical protein APUTEX25_004579 [Auxenochlorella protothecoides]|eukprot:RMZ56155.1 hypothetical protein APUTEX25_004579 [Auxenochlorella protothecoides]